MNEMKFSVLVVDDEYHICENICSKIKMMNMKEIGEVKTCYSGEEALEICRDYKPEIVIHGHQNGRDGWNRNDSTDEKNPFSRVLHRSERI